LKRLKVVPFQNFQWTIHYDVYPGVTDAKEELIYIIYMNHPESNNLEYLIFLYSLDLGELYELYNE